MMPDRPSALVHGKCDSCSRQHECYLEQEDRWQYWLACALEQRNDAASNVVHKQFIKKWHRVMIITTCWRKIVLGKLTTQFPANTQPSAHDLQRLNQDIHFNRAFALREINAPANYVNREWNWAVRQALFKTG